MKKTNIVTILIFLLAVPGTLILGSKMPGRWYYLTSTLIMIELLIPFFLKFEGRKPQARELVVLAVMCALVVAARVAIPIPNFKAIYAIIMIAGIAFGPESGFLVGAVSALSSNFFLSQGPYTPWQMMAYGAGGMLAGLLFRKGRLPRKPSLMGIAGFLGGTAVGWSSAGYLHRVPGSHFHELGQHSHHLHFRFYGEYQPGPQYLPGAVSAGQSHAGKTGPHQSEIRYDGGRRWDLSVAIRR